MTEASIRTRPKGPANTVLQPAGWPRPKGFANGIRARGEMVFVGGMIGQDSQGRFAEGFVPQMKLALENIAAVLKEAGATPAHIVRLTWYVLDIDEYLADLPPNAIPSHRQWIPDRVNFFVVAFNTAKVKREEIPKSYTGFTDPKWRGRIGIEATDAEWMATLVKTWGEAAGMAYFRSLAGMRSKVMGNR